MTPLGCLTAKCKLRNSPAAVQVAVSRKAWVDVWLFWGCNFGEIECIPRVLVVPNTLLVKRCTNETTGRLPWLLAWCPLLPSLWCGGRQGMLISKNEKKKKSLSGWGPFVGKALQWSNVGPCVWLKQRFGSSLVEAGDSNWRFNWWLRLRHEQKPLCSA